MPTLKLNKVRLTALLLAMALLVPMWPVARAETVGDPPAQGDVVTPPAQEPPSTPTEPEDSGQPEGDLPNEGAESNSGLSAATADISLGAITPPDDALLTPQVTLNQIPSFEFETRVTTDAFGIPDGYVELLIKVKTPGAEQMFSLALSMEYSDELEPANWSGGNIAMGSVNFATYIPAKHPVSMTSAEAYGDDGRHLYVYAESTAFPQLTAGETVAAVRFHCKNQLMYKDGKIVKVNNSGYDPSDPTTATDTTAVTLFQWNTDAVAATTPKSRRALLYASKDTLLYHVPAYDPTNAATYEPVTLTVDGAPVTINKPKTAGEVVLATKQGTPTNYSYLTNHVPVANISWTETTGESFDNSGGGITLDDVATVVFFDWDDTFLGATAVARGIDNRQTINDFVKAAMIHPDLKNNTNYSSLDRKDTYRGEYPCESPTTGVKFPDDHATQPGKNYPLTNKLDYAFYKKVVEVKDGVPTVKADSDATYPYIHGWQSVTPLTMSDTWTALESNQAVASADFKKITEDVVYVKALYEPGTKLNFGSSGDFFTIGDKESYSRYGNATSYVIRFEYNRVNSDEYGVTRPKEPAIQMIMRFENSNVYMRVDVKNQDKIAVELTPAKEVIGVDYLLVDAKGSSIVAAASKSDQSGLGTFKNYDSTGAQGTLGFVRSGTVAWFVEQLYENATTGVSSEWAFATYVAMNDCGFKRTAAGAAFAATPPANLNNAKVRLQNVMIEALANGVSTNLTWHQLQYAILKSSAPFYLPADQAKAWCIQNCTFLPYYNAGYINGITPDPAPDIP